MTACWFEAMAALSGEVLTIAQRAGRLSHCEVFVVLKLRPRCVGHSVRAGVQKSNQDSRFANARKHKLSRRDEEEGEVD